MDRFCGKIFPGTKNISRHSADSTALVIVLLWLEYRSLGFIELTYESREGEGSIFVIQFRAS